MLVLCTWAWAPVYCVHVCVHVPRSAADTRRVTNPRRLARAATELHRASAWVLWHCCIQARWDYRAAEDLCTRAKDFDCTPAQRKRMEECPCVPSAHKTCSSGGTSQALLGRWAGGTNHTAAVAAVTGRSTAQHSHTADAIECPVGSCNVQLGVQRGSSVFCLHEFGATAHCLGEFHGAAYVEQPAETAHPNRKNSNAQRHIRHDHLGTE